MTTVPLPRRPVAIRPLALPNEHGGWGFLLEPIVLALLVAPSWSGGLVATAAVFGFLVRHPLRLALQDAVRGKRYPRTIACRVLALSYLIAAGLALAAAVMIGGIRILIPLGLVAPLALTQVLYDGWNRSRELLPEMSGAAAMSSVAAAIAIGGGMPIAAALGLSGIILARSLPSILYVRRLLGRMPAWPAVVLHVAAVAFVALYASPYAVAAMVILLLRAVWGVTHEAPRAQTIGWREIVFGAVTVFLAALAY
ncbi:MAG TPA: YwiC-like family protein, partial [Thermoanaerobaculia bacterium]|nr:YwiC-like family protein [Thermoanaerobaculia bacterium]